MGEGNPVRVTCLGELNARLARCEAGSGPLNDLSPALTPNRYLPATCGRGWGVRCRHGGDERRRARISGEPQLLLSRRHSSGMASVAVGPCTRMPRGIPLPGAEGAAVVFVRARDPADLRPTRARGIRLRAHRASLPVTVPQRSQGPWVVDPAQRAQRQCQCHCREQEPEVTQRDVEGAPRSRRLTTMPASHAASTGAPRRGLRSIGAAEPARTKPTRTESAHREPTRTGST